MKALLVDISPVPDKKTGIMTAWAVFTKLGQFSNTSGKVFHFNVSKDSKTPMVQQIGVSSAENEALYNKLVKLLPGALVDLEFGVSSRGSVVVKDVLVVSESPYTFDELHK